MGRESRKQGPKEEEGNAAINAIHATKETKTHRTSSVAGSVIYRIPIKLSECSGGGSCCLDVLSGSDSDSRIQDGEWPE